MPLLNGRTDVDYRVEVQGHGSRCRPRSTDANQLTLISRGSVLGSPSLFRTQPGGQGNPSFALLRIRPAATVVVAISSRNGRPWALGAAKDQGSVPSFASLPKVGATWMLEALVHAIP